MAFTQATVFDAQGKLVEQGLFAADKLVTPLGRN